MDEEFRKIFEKFSFTDVAASEVFYCTTKKLIRIRFSVDKAYQTTGVRFEVLCAVNKTEKVEEVAPELLEMSRKRRKFVHLLTFFLWILLGLLSLLCSLESSVVVSAGLLRIFGCNIVELLLVATSREHQGKGYFQVLFSCIERLLSSLNVEKLVLPAVGDAESIWTKKLGFHKMSEDQVSIISQALIFVTRSRSWSYVERPGLLLLFAFFAAEMVFARINGIGWRWAGVIWIFTVVTYIPLDVLMRSGTT
ncbi:unnamed protein product [Trifolium pratense]|uniref:Uncharacterized protein n=1 Tax=Trifolium pratense TaxID=57577 RepID=A0ACB0JL36_TRIPR|nr:unnamed protein product [Trifolium pratense]